MCFDVGRPATRGDARHGELEVLLHMEISVGDAGTDRLGSCDRQCKTSGRQGRQDATITVAVCWKQHVFEMQEDGDAMLEDECCKLQGGRPPATGSICFYWNLTLFLLETCFLFVGTMYFLARGGRPADRRRRGRQPAGEASGPRWPANWLGFRKITDCLYHRRHGYSFSFFNEPVGEGEGHRAVVIAQIVRAQCDRPKFSVGAPVPSSALKYFNRH